MQIFFIILFISNLLFANCYPIKENIDSINVIEDGIEHCISIKDQNICIERDLVKLKKKGANEYQAICINGERVASGYPRLEGKTTKVGKWLKIDELSVDANNIYFQYEKRLFRYNFSSKSYSVIELPKGIVKTKQLVSGLVAIEYINNNRLQLAILDKKLHHLKRIRNLDADIVLRRGNIIDFVQSSDRNFLENYIQKIKDEKTNLKAILKSDDTFKRELPRYASVSNPIKEAVTKQTLQTPFTTLVKSLPKQTLSNGELLVTTVLINNSLRPLSIKSFVVSQNDYLKLLDEEYKDLKEKFVWESKSYLILFVTLFSIGVITLWVRRLVGTISLPTISSFFLFWYILIPVVGSTIMNIFYTEYEYNLGFYERKDLIFNTWLYTIIGLYFIPLGMQFANWLFRYDAANSFNTFREQPISYLYEKALFVVVLVSMFISFIVLYIYIQKIGTVPILGVLQHLSPTQLAELRSQASNGFDGKLYRYLFFIKTLPMLWLIVAYFYKFVSRKWLVTFIVLLVYNIFISIMNLEKAPLVNLLMILLIVHFFIVGRINWRYLLLFILVAIGALLVMYIFFMGVSSKGLLDTLAAPFHRAFVGTISPFFWWKLYSEQYGFLHGLTLPNPHHLFNFDNVQVSTEVMAFVHPELKDLGIVGSMPTVFWADWYINFGVFAIFLGMILFGFIMQSLDIFLINRMKKRKRVLMLALFVYLLFYFKRYIATSYLGILFDTNIVLPVLLFIVLNSILKRKFAIDEKSDLNRS